MSALCPEAKGVKCSSRAAGAMYMSLLQRCTGALHGNAGVENLKVCSYDVIAVDGFSGTCMPLEQWTLTAQCTWAASANFEASCSCFDWQL